MSRLNVASWNQGAQCGEELFNQYSEGTVGTCNNGVIVESRGLQNLKLIIISGVCLEQGNRF